MTLTGAALAAAYGAGWTYLVLYRGRRHIPRHSSSKGAGTTNTPPRVPEGVTHDSEPARLEVVASPYLRIQTPVTRL